MASIPRLLGAASALALTAAFSLAAPTLAQTAPAAPASTAPAAPAAWADTLAFTGQVEAGFTANPLGPPDHRNFGQLFTDHANQPVLNQILLTAQRPLDPKAEGWDFGFKLQGMYGADARYTHFMGEFDRVIHDTNQIDLVEANALIHSPLLGSGGTDLKIGQYPTPLGYEVIDASGNPLYSHSYIFNFGLPFKHTGGYATVHATDLLDLYAGVDSGTNTWIGSHGDNNDAAAGMAGFGLNMLGGNLTVLALSHFGPENARGAVDFSGKPIDVDGEFRYFNDVVVTWKASDKVTSITEINFVRDDGVNANGGGIAQYITYTFNDNWSLTGRGEVFNDQKGFYVAKFEQPLDFVNAERGLPTSSGGVVSGGKNTYTEVTLGVTWKPELPKPVSGFMLRPEIRYDHASHPVFGDGSDDNQVTFAADFVLQF